MRTPSGSHQIEGLAIDWLPIRQGSPYAGQAIADTSAQLDLPVGWLVDPGPPVVATPPAWDGGPPGVVQLGAPDAQDPLPVCGQRGVRVDRTYQLNTGGNTDFMNMLDRQRLGSKKESKTEAVQAMLAQRLEDENIHVGPSDYVPWQKDNKLCFLRMEGNLWGNVPMNLELRLSVEDSPNSAAVVMDAIRCIKLALERGEGGALTGPSAFYCKHPPHQFNDDLAAQMVDEYISGTTALAAE